jgi:hypothetical protein
MIRNTRITLNTRITWNTYFCHYETLSLIFIDIIIGTFVPLLLGSDTSGDANCV